MITIEDKVYLVNSHYDNPWTAPFVCGAYSTIEKAEIAMKEEEDMNKNGRYSISELYIDVVDEY